jgi:hypothetical protein
MTAMWPRTLLLCVALLAATIPSMARTPARRALDQAVTTLAVKGSIEIDAQGRVQRYTLGHPEAYSPAVREMLDRIVPQWTFRPVLVDGVPRPARSAMYLRLRADPIGNDQFRIVVASAAFGAGEDAMPGTQVAADVRSMAPPKYPKDERIARIGGQVLVVLRIGRDGRVEDAIAEQTNLDQLGTPKAMARWRRDFESDAIAGMKHWTFVTPTAGPDAGAPYWSVRVPVTFTPARGTSPAPGQWESYVPGPRRPVPWATDEEQALADAGNDALPDSGIFPLKPALQLLTSLDPG